MVRHRNALRSKMMRGAVVVFNIPNNAIAFAIYSLTGMIGIHPARTKAHVHSCDITRCVFSFLAAIVTKLAHPHPPL